MAEKNTFSSIQEGLESTNRSSDGESLMKGRTYISRLSPDTREALVKALRERRKKKSDEKMASRKAASDDYFASEADKSLYKRQDQSLKSIRDAEMDAEDKDLKSWEDGLDNFYDELKKLEKEKDQKKADAIEDKLKKLSIEQEASFKKGGKTPKYEYGGKTKKYRK